MLAEPVAIDLSDPNFEPTDEQLVGLAKRAFANLEERRLDIDTKLRARIRAAREERKLR
jgi:hypothetical protein